MPTHNAGGSPRDVPGFARLAAMAKDQESICSQLMASAKYFEAQLTALRAEHEALRRCLDRSGVLPADELEKEVQSCSSKAAACNEVSSSTGSPTPALSGTGLQADSSCAAPSRPYSLTLPAEDAAATTLTSSPTFSGRRSADSPRRGCSPSQGGYPAPGASALVNGSRAMSPLKASRGRSPNKSCERAESTEGRKSRPRSRSSARVMTEDADGEAAGPEGDLYELMSKLLDQGTSVAEQQRAVRAVQQLLKRSAEPPNAWNGPGTPLSAVVRAGRSDLARLLLRARANVNERDAKGVSALHVATYDGNAELCRVLLVARADVDACDRHGQTPLFFVPNRDICKLLIERRSDVTVLNRKGQSALHLAGRAGLHEVLAWLSSRVSKNLVELRDVHGATARAYAQQSGVPKPEATSPRSSRGQRAGSPRVPSRGRSPQALQRATSPQAATGPTGPPLRGGGGQARAAAMDREAAAAASAQVPRNDVRRGSGQLPYVSELVEEGDKRVAPGRAHGGAAAGDKGSGAQAGDSAYDGYEKAAPSQRVAQHAAAVLEAAAAVATAAVATAAELEAAQKGEAADEAGVFDNEADTWPVQAEGDYPVEIGRLGGGGAPPAPIARGPGAVAPGAQLAQEPTPEVDLSEIGVIHEANADEDLAELGVMEEGDALFAHVLTPSAGGSPVEQIKEADEEEADDDFEAEEAGDPEETGPAEARAPAAAALAGDNLPEPAQKALEGADPEQADGRALVEDGIYHDCDEHEAARAPEAVAEDEEEEEEDDELLELEGADEPPVEAYKTCVPSQALLRLEDELDEAF